MVWGAVTGRPHQLFGPYCDSTDTLVPLAVPGLTGGVSGGTSWSLCSRTILVLWEKPSSPTLLLHVPTKPRAGPGKGVKSQGGFQVGEAHSKTHWE